MEGLKVLQTGKTTGDNENRNDNRANGQNPRRQSHSNDGARNQGSQDDNGNVAVTAVNSNEGDDGQAELAVKPKVRRTSRRKEPTVEGISEDAAGLPQGLLGAGTMREPSVVDE